MTTFEAANLKSEYFKWLFNEESFDNIGSVDRPVVRIETPFFDGFLNGIDLYVYPDENNLVLITDNGIALDNLESAGIIFDECTKARTKLLKSIVESCDVNMPDHSKTLSVRTSQVHFAEAKNRLLQAVLQITGFAFIDSK